MCRRKSRHLHSVDPLFERKVTVTSLAVERSVLGGRVLHVESDQEQVEGQLMQSNWRIQGNVRVVTCSTLAVDSHIISSPGLVDVDLSLGTHVVEELLRVDSTLGRCCPGSGVDYKHGRMSNQNGSATSGKKHIPAVPFRFSGVKLSHSTRRVMVSSVCLTCKCV